MRKILLAGILSILFAGAAHAQGGPLTPAPFVSGNLAGNGVCIALHMATSNVGYSVSVSGTWTGTVTISQSGDNQANWTTATTTTGNTLYTSALLPGISDARACSTAAQTGTIVVTITASGPATIQNITQTGGGGITSVSSLPGTCTPGVTPPVQLSTPPFGIFYCSATNTWAVSSADSGVVDPTGYGAKFDGKACFGNVNTITTNGTTVTCNVGNFCNGSSVACAAGQTSDVGKQFTATNGCCAVAANYQGVSLLTSPSTATTITAVTNSTTITISQSAGVSSGASLIIAWATNDDAAITAAETAWQSGNKCRSIQLPAGITAVLIPHFTNPGANCLAMEPQADYTAQVQGQGIGATVLGIFPGFAWASCTANSNTCFGNYLEQSWMNFQFNGFGWGNTGAGSAKNLIGIGLGGQVNQVACNSTGGSDTNLTGLVSGLGARVWGISWDGCGNTGWTVSGITKAYYCFIGDTLGANLNIQPGNDMTDFGCDYGISGGTTVINQAGRYHGIGSNLFGCGATNAVAINMGNAANAVTILDGARFNCTSAGTSQGVFMNAATQKLVLASGTVVGGLFAPVQRSAGTIFTDPSVSFLGGGSITYFAPTCVFTTGGGTTPSCSLQAGSTNEKGVIIATTGTGAPGTTGTITLTFAGTYSGASGAAPACTYTLDNSGTAWGNEAVSFVSTQSTTVPVVAWSNVATAVLTALATSSPYRIDYTCTAR